MPMNLGYVLTCYGIFLFTVIFYMITLIHKKNKYSEALRHLKQGSQRITGGLELRKATPSNHTESHSSE